jgi:SAM-dependent MidA family methyltransferase
MNGLIDWIAKKGPVPFSQYMEWALYHPQFGYYTTHREIFGTRGDYYTSPGVHSVFAETLADWIVQRWTEMFPDKPLRIVEMGAGNGKLAEAMIPYLANKRAEHPPLASFSYWIVERSEHLQALQQERLAGYISHVFWAVSLTEIPRSPMVVLSNELLDAFPVDIVRRVGDNWEMQYVTYDSKSEAFRAIWRPVAAEDSCVWQHLHRIPEGCMCEINRGIPDWVRQVNEVVSEGFVLTIDYGGDTDELYGLHHPEGTIRAYVRHQVSGNVLEAPGSCDLTADVDFSYLEFWTRKHGWIRERYETQGAFLVHAGILQKLQDVDWSLGMQQPARTRNMAIKHLILPGGMGDAFRVVVHRIPADR